MTQTLTTERLREIAEDGFLEHGDAKAIAAELMANREAQPVAFDALADAVKEVTGGIRMEFTPGTYKGHQPVPFMNFTSLSRIVEMFRTAPLVPEEVYYDDCPDLYPSQPDAWASGWNACRAAMLAAAPEGGNGA
jgi:hypothetical protein